jgi:hypothetical protein
MNTYWWIWTVIAIIAFIIGEKYAFDHGNRQNTLSRWIYDIGKTWPLSIFLMGMMIGGLAVHFFWHWCPDMGTGVGVIDLSCIPTGCLSYSNLTGN